MKGSLAELAAMPGMPSEPTIRKLIAEHDDFPILSRGDRGQAYELNLEEAARFILGLREREEQEARARANDVRQLGLQLLGEGAALETTARAGLSLADQRELMTAEIEAMKAAKLRGSLISRADVEAGLAEFVGWVVEMMNSLPARLAKRVALDRSTMGAIERLIDGDRRELARRMTELENGIGTASAGAAAALRDDGLDPAAPGDAGGAAGAADGQPMG